MAHISSYAVRADLDYGQSPSSMPGGGLNASQPWPIGGGGPQAGETGRQMPFPASNSRRAWPHFAKYVEDGNGGYYDDGTGEDPNPTGDDPEAQDEADTAASISADGESESSVWEKIGSGVLSLGEAALKYGPGLYTAYTKAQAGATPTQIAAAKAAAAQAKANGAVAPVKGSTLFTPMNIGIGLLALFAAYKLSKG